MLFLKYLLIVACCGIFAGVAGMVLYDIFLAYELDRLLKRREKQTETLGKIDVPAPQRFPAGPGFIGFGLGARKKPGPARE
jgi:hypothetical protein